MTFNEQLFADKNLLLEKIKKADSLSKAETYYADLIAVTSILKQNDMTCDYSVDQNIDLLYKKNRIKSIDTFIDNCNVNKEFSNDLSDKVINDFINSNFFDFVELYTDDNPIFTEKEYKDIIFDFFNEYDPNLYKWLKDLFERISLFSNVNPGFNGLTYSLPSLEKSYILLSNKNCSININKIKVLIHEIGHAYHLKLINDSKINNFNNGLFSIHLEVPSCTFERLFTDYMINKKINISNAIIEKNIQFYMLFKNFTYLYIATYLNNIDICNGFMLKTDDFELANIIEIMKKEFGILINNDQINLRSACNYSTGYLMSSYFLELFKQDHQEAKIIFEKYISNIGNINDFDIFNNFGFSKEKLLTSYIISKQLEEHTNKIKTLII